MNPSRRLVFANSMLQNILWSTVSIRGFPFKKRQDDVAHIYTQRRLNKGEEHSHIPEIQQVGCEGFEGDEQKHDDEVAIDKPFDQTADWIAVLPRKVGLRDAATDEAENGTSVQGGHWPQYPHQGCKLGESKPVEYVKHTRNTDQCEVVNQYQPRNSGAWRQCRRWRSRSWRCWYR